MPTLQESLKDKTAAFKDFGKSYCFLELLVGKQKNRASGERKWLEVLYRKFINS